MSDNRTCILIMEYWNDQGSQVGWTLRINVPGVVPWKGMNCAANFEKYFHSDHYTREKVVAIGKKIAQDNKWRWEDISSPKEDGIYEEFIDYFTNETHCFKIKNVPA